jgi:hypothetical protein
MDPTIIVALIGGVATVLAAYIGRKTGKESGRELGREEGREEGRKHSILRFMDEQEKQLDRAATAIEKKDERTLRAVAAAMVDNVETWRRIQESLAALLNGRIDDLRGTLRSDNATIESIQSTVLAYREGFRARRLAIETELEKSKI